MHVTVFHPNPDKREPIISGLRAHLPATYTVDDHADGSTEYLVAWAPPPSLFDDLPGVKACFSLGAGVDQLLKTARLPDAVPLYRLEDAGMGDQMARYCRHEVEQYRLLCWRYQNQQRNKEWIEHEPLDPSQIRVGLYGLGVLGKQVAWLLQQDGYSVHAYRRTAASADDDCPVYSGQSGLAKFLGSTQVLILIAPLTADTHGIVNERTLHMLPPGAWVINVARGELVKDDDLLAAIHNGHVAGASLDVFATEPLPVDHPYWTEPNIRVTPHIAALTRVAESTEQIAAKILRLSDGLEATGLVIRERGY